MEQLALAIARILEAAADLGLDKNEILLRVLDIVEVCESEKALETMRDNAIREK